MELSFGGDATGSFVRHAMVEKNNIHTCTLPHPVDRNLRLLLRRKTRFPPFFQRNTINGHFGGSTTRSIALGVLMETMVPSIDSFWYRALLI